MLMAIRKRVEKVKNGRCQGKPRLQVMPIIGPSHEEPHYRLLDKSIMDKVHVTEVDESGQVPVLKVENKLDELVFLMDGQELVGAKQNRILNTDVLVPANSTIKIPVSCVEQGRWNHISREFQPGKSASFSVRRGKHQRVHQALKEERGHDADQGEVWNEVEESLDKASCSSPTMALHQAYEARSKQLDDIRKELQLPEDSVGIAVFRAGKIQGLDIFDRHSTLKYFWDSLVDSYAIDLLDETIDLKEDKDIAEQPAIKTVLQCASTGNWQGFDSPGEGADYRLEDDSFSGSALVWDGRVVIHLQLFPKQANSDAAGTGHRSRPRIHRHYL